MEVRREGTHDSDVDVAGAESGREDAAHRVACDTRGTYVEVRLEPNGDCAACRRRRGSA